ncbi:hypothetical protein ACFL21_01750 [Patescibacteria group bacterium]
MNIILDKIGSVTKNIPLDHQVKISDNIESTNGLVLAVKVLDDKKVYNQLELVTGRLSKLKKGDKIAVALGNRKALKGFVGEIPEKLQVGDIINILNLGGVAGICTSENFYEVGHALKVEVLGVIFIDGYPVNIQDYKLFEHKDHLDSSVPLIVVSGTCMSVGKTTVACEIIKHLTDNGYKVNCAKLAGVAALRDTENMRDYGAKVAVSFLDAGFASTVKSNGKSLLTTKGAIDYLSQDNPDYIVIEFGDGIFGEYGVMEIIKDNEIQNNMIAHIGCAHDPMGAAKLIEICDEIGSPIDIISGPVSDNCVGEDFIRKKLFLPSFNAISNGKELFDNLYSLCLRNN